MSFESRKIRMILEGPSPDAIITITPAWQRFCWCTADSGDSWASLLRPVNSLQYDTASPNNNAVVSKDPASPIAYWWLQSQSHYRFNVSVTQEFRGPLRFTKYFGSAFGHNYADSLIKACLNPTGMTESRPLILWPEDLQASQYAVTHTVIDRTTNTIVFPEVEIPAGGTSWYLTLTSEKVYTEISPGVPAVYTAWGSFTDTTSDMEGVIDTDENLAGGNLLFGSFPI